jgi:GTPase involved in cell partitioning and DNA repair
MDYQEFKEMAREEAARIIGQEIQKLDGILRERIRVIVREEIDALVEQVSEHILGE